MAYAAFKRHCGLYVMSSAVIEAHKDAFAPYDTAKTKTTIRSAPIGRFRPRSSGSS